MEPMTEEQKKKMLQKANAYKKRKSKMAMQKESRRRNRGK